MDIVLITKRYYAPSTGSGRGGDRQIAMNVNGELYYTLLAPTGTSLTIVDDQGSQAAYLLYDAYGDILTQVISSTLTGALATTGDLADPATGLVHLGGGRFYDPGLGRPLQPNPVGGPPTVPQALNRYGATSLGPPGVAEGVRSGVGVLPDVIGVVKSLTVDYASDLLGQTSTVIGYRYSGQIAFDILAVHFDLTQYTRTVLPQSNRLTANFTLTALSESELLAEAVEKRAELIAALPGYKIATDWRLRNITPYPVQGALDDLVLAKFLREGVGLGLDVAIDAYFQYRADMNNPRRIHTGISYQVTIWTRQ